MAAKRIIRSLLWILIALAACLGLIAVLLQTEFLQTQIARYFVERVNRSIPGRLVLGGIHVSPAGEIHLSDVSVVDQSGSEVIGFNELLVQLEFRPLLNNRALIDDLQISGLRVDLALDSSGALELTNVLGADTSGDDDEPTGSEKWMVRIDEARIRGDRLHVVYDREPMLDLTAWSIDGKGSYENDSLNYRLAFDAPGALEARSDGHVTLAPELVADLRLALNADSSLTAQWPHPAPLLGNVSLDTEIALDPDSLSCKFQSSSSSLGDVSGQVRLANDFENLRGRGRLDFTQMNLTALLPDSLPVIVNGGVEFTKLSSGDAVNGWDVTLNLDGSQVMGERVHALLEIQTADSVATVRGSLDTGHGASTLNLAIAGFAYPAIAVDGSLKIRKLELPHFLPEIPDSLGPLTGTIDLSLSHLDPDSIEGWTHLIMTGLDYGRYHLDSIALTAVVDHHDFSVDTFRIVFGEIQCAGHAEGALGDHASFAASASIPDLTIIQEILHGFEIDLDSLGGAVNGHLQGTASLKGDSLSQWEATGTLTGTEIHYGEYRVTRADIGLASFESDALQIAASAKLTGLAAREEMIDSLALTFRGSVDEFTSFTEIWARSDTLHLAAAVDGRIDDNEMRFLIDNLRVRTFGAQWRTLHPTRLTIAGDSVAVDAMTIQSEFGTIRAVGSVQLEGMQDLTIAITGLETGRLAPLLDTPIPDATLDAHLHVGGSDSALTGDLVLLAEGVSYDEKPIADDVALVVVLEEDRALLSGHSIWYGDTLAVLECIVPLHLSLDQGLVLVDSLPLAGQVHVKQQPLARFNPWLQQGTKTEGNLTADFSIAGTLAEPNWRGNFSVRDGRYTDSRIGVNYRYIVVDGELTRDTLYIRQFRATSRGTLSGSGFAVMGLPYPERIDLKLNFDRFIAVESPAQKARLSGTVTVSGAFDSLDASGRLTIEELVYRISQTTMKEIEEIDLEAYLSELRGDTVIERGLLLTDLYHGMSHTLELEIPGNCWIRGSGLNIELSGELLLSKNKREEPSINGEIRVQRGKVKIVGRELGVTSGRITYSGPLDDPALDIVAEDRKIKRREGAVVEAHLYGTMAESRIDFRGTYPNGSAMTEQEAIGALITGSTATSGGQGVQQTAAAIAGGQVSDIVEQASGLDLFEFRPGEGGVNDLSSGTLEIGTYVTDRLFVRVLQPIETEQQGQEVTIEYQLQQWLKLIAEQKGAEQSAFDIYVQLEWR